MDIWRDKDCNFRPIIYDNVFHVQIEEPYLHILLKTPGEFVLGEKTRDLIYNLIDLEKQDIGLMNKLLVKRALNSIPQYMNTGLIRHEFLSLADLSDRVNAMVRDFAETLNVFYTNSAGVVLFAGTDEDDVRSKVLNVLYRHGLHAYTLEKLDGEHSVYSERELYNGL